MHVPNTTIIALTHGQRQAVIDGLNGMLGRRAQRRAGRQMSEDDAAITRRMMELRDRFERSQHADIVTMSLRLWEIAACAIATRRTDPILSRYLDCRVNGNDVARQMRRVCLENKMRRIREAAGIPDAVEGGA